MQSIDNVLMLRKGLKPNDPNPDIFDVLWAKKLSAIAEKFITLTGNPLSFITKKAQTAVSTKVTLEPIQAGSGDPSPTNIRPISGRSSVEIKGCGKNLFDKDTCVFIASKYISATGEIESNGSYNYCETYIPVKPSTNYVFSGNIVSNITTNSVAFYSEDKSFISRFQPSRGENAQFTTPENTRYIRFNVGKITYNINTIQIEEGSTATAYEPYTESNDITITFGETVYSGTLDVETGECVVDKIMYHLYALSWTYSSTTGSFTNKKGSKNIKMNSTPICSCFIGMPSVNANAAVTSMGDNRIVFKRSADDQRIYAKYSAANGDVDVFISAVNGQYICCQMETPSTIQLTPAEVQLLKGMNTIWIEDVGATIALTYKN